MRLKQFLIKVKEKMDIVPIKSQRYIGWDEDGYYSHSKISGFHERVNPKTGKFINPKYNIYL